MTALKEYDRLEATGLWRAGPDAQRREVIVSIGDATLVITDLRDHPLTHWSLAAVKRQNPGILPATYSPDGDPEETLELAESEKGMIDALERVRRAVDRSRPKPGRLRNMGALVSVAIVLAVAVFWLPDALTHHTASVLPYIKRTEIGEALLARAERGAGRPCQSASAVPALLRIADRTGTGRIVVLQGGVRDSLGLPGGIILLNKALVEDHEDPAVLAGYVIAERLRSEQSDPLADFLRHAGPFASFRLLTTGDVTEADLDAYSEHLLLRPHQPVAETRLLDAFGAASVPSTPYAYALDLTGETVVTLVEADPFVNVVPPPLLSDRDWLLLQEICGG